MSVLDHASGVSRALKNVSVIGLAAAFTLLLSVGANAQQVELPPLIRIIVPFGPGGTTDLYARAVAAQLGARLKRTVIVENKSGANGWIGTKTVADAPKDGSVLMSSTLSLLTNAATTVNPSTDVMKTIIPVAIMSELPLLVATSPKSGIKTPEALLAAARSKPGEMTYSTGGSGTVVHLAGELLQQQAKIELRHIPYKGGSAANTDVVAGHVDFTMAAPATLTSLIAGGKMNLVAVTSAQPHPAFPGVPTMASVVPGYAISVWTAIWAPAGTPTPIVQRLNQEINEIVKTKEFEALLRDDGAVTLSLTPAEAAEKARQTYTMWKELATAKKISVE